MQLEEFVWTLQQVAARDVAVRELTKALVQSHAHNDMHAARRIAVQLWELTSGGY